MDGGAVRSALWHSFGCGYSLLFICNPSGCASDQFDFIRSLPDTFVDSQSLLYYRRYTPVRYFYHRSRTIRFLGFPFRCFCFAVYAKAPGGCGKYRFGDYRFVYILLYSFRFFADICFAPFSSSLFLFCGCQPFRQVTLVLLLLSGGFLFLGMRSSIQTSTANVGMVYHSQNQFINQASVNPAFNLFATLSQERDFTSQTSFFTAEERASLYQELNTPLIPADSVAIERPNIKPKRPNIVLILLESFSANAIGALGGTPGLTPSLDSIAEESVLFTHTYASSFRTDRGIAAAISGYPGQPASSILKYPEKSRTLPSIARTLKENGYGTYMLYGGDIDFTNMRSYFLGTGYEKITEVNDFPLKQRTGKWGVRDEHTFALLAHACKKLSGKGRPFLYTLLTLSSHEPFDVPIEVHSDPYLNSIAYTDGCIGKFMREMKNEPAVWNNTLFVFVSDHGYPYPKEATPESLLRYKIIMMWAGGALERGMKVDRIMAQTDLPLR